jgi:hypothetical protein
VGRARAAAASGWPRKQEASEDAHSVVEEHDKGGVIGRKQRQELRLVAAMADSARVRAVGSEKDERGEQ